MTEILSDWGVALIGAGALVLVAIMQRRTQRENRADHGAVQRRLDRIETKIDDTRDALTDHIEWETSQRFLTHDEIRRLIDDATDRYHEGNHTS